MSPVVSATGLHYVPTDRAVLDDVHIEVTAGEMLAVTGPSGSGKSSLLALLAGLAVPTSGEVQVDGAPLAPGADTGFGLVLQGYGLVSVLTAAENVEVPLQAHGVARAEAMDRAARALDSVGLGELADRRVDELSGGQRQDAGTKAALLALLRAAAAAGTAVVVATHDPEVVAVCDREVALHDGRLVHP